MKPSYDKKGIPIRAGDILKVHHFTGASNKKYYMYKMACVHSWYADDPIFGYQKKSRLMASHLRQDTIHGLNERNPYPLPEGILEDYEIVQGYNNEGDELDFNDRPRIQVTK